MRLVSSVVLSTAMILSGCGSLRDVFSSHSETAARVGSRELKSAHVADIISRVGGANANPDAAEVVAGIWVDLALFGEGVARGTLKADSALLERLLWPQIAQSKSNTWHDSLVARRPPVGEAVVDSAYNGEGVRLFQHILLTATGTTAADTAKAKALADRILPQARAGNFGRLAAQHSADGSKADSGFLPVWPRGATVPEFDTVGWRLRPGEVSGVVKSQFGFHIIRRPTLAEARGRMLEHLKQARSVSEDSLYTAQLNSQNDVKLKSGAAAAMRSALSDLPAARKSGKVLVTYRDGKLTVGDFARWMGALDPQRLGQVRAAPDSMLTNFATNLAQNALLLRQADSAKIAVNPAFYQGMALQYQSMIGDLKQALGLDAPEFSDTSKTPESERVTLAGQKVDEYFDKLTKGQAQFRPMPPTLSAELRAEGDYKIYQAGIARAVELIVAKRRADSAAGANTQPAPGGLQPAPGGPPTPNPRPNP